MYNLKTPNSQIQSTDWSLSEAGGEGWGMGEGGQELQTCSHRVSQSGDATHSMAGAGNKHCVAYFKVAKTVGLKASHYKKKIAAT